MISKRIVYQMDDGSVAVIIPCLDCGLTVEEIADKDVPTSSQFYIVDASQIPEDRTFRGAWRLSDGNIVHNIEIAKTIAHEMRRSFREKEFEPLDTESTIPSLSSSAESARKLIREKYAAMQIAIESSSSVFQIKAALAA
jgi:hypothetical protein